MVMNREGWLTELAKRSEQFFKSFRIAPYRVTCGFPSKKALSANGRVVGQCFTHEWSKGGYHELFVSPVLDDTADVAGTVVHELTHVAASVKSGHGPNFVKMCNYVGLTRGKPKDAMPGERLADDLRTITDALGKYPHDGIVPAAKETTPRTKSLVSLECPACGCKLTISLKWLADSGPPTCGCGAGFTLPEGE